MAPLSLYILFSLVLSMLFCISAYFAHYVVLSCSLCSILFGFVTFSVSFYTLYSLGFSLLSLSLSQCSLYLSFLYSILFGSLVVTISVSFLYAILFGLPLVVSGCLSPVSLGMLFHTIQWSSLYLSAFWFTFPSGLQ